MGFMWSALDESTDKKQKYGFVVAGYLARQEDWTEIERKWTLRLESESDPEPMKYFSTSECGFLSGQFARFRDPVKYPRPLGRQAADKIRLDLLEIVKNSPAYGCALGLGFNDYKAVRRKSERNRKVLLPDPYEHMYTMLMIIIAGDLEEEYEEGLFPARETCAYLCDGHDKYAKVKGVYEELKRHNPTCAQWMGSITDMDNEDSPALQAGDLLAGLCKEELKKMIKRGDVRKLASAEFRELVGPHVRFRCFDRETLQQLVDANVLKRGKPSIHSTQQLLLAKDFIIGTTKKAKTHDRQKLK